MKIKRLPAGFVVPTQPIKASKPPSGADWVHEIKHDGYRLIVRRDGPTVRLYTRNAYDWTARLQAIADWLDRERADVAGVGFACGVANKPHVAPGPFTSVPSQRAGASDRDPMLVHRNAPIWRAWILA
jgi:ATP-dependent DNA ligase